MKFKKHKFRPKQILAVVDADNRNLVLCSSPPGGSRDKGHPIGAFPSHTIHCFGRCIVKIPLTPGETEICLARSPVFDPR